MLLNKGENYDIRNHYKNINNSFNKLWLALMAQMTFPYICQFWMQTIECKKSSLLYLFRNLYFFFEQFFYNILAVFFCHFCTVLTTKWLPCGCSILFCLMILFPRHSLKINYITFDEMRTTLWCQQFVHNHRHIKCISVKELRVTHAFILTSFSRLKMFPQFHFSFLLKSIELMKDSDHCGPLLQLFCTQVSR